jgi:hypothetical protein
MKKQLIGLIFCILSASYSPSLFARQETVAPFKISTESFVLNSKAYVIRCGELKSQVGKSENVFDLQYTGIWHSQWKNNSPKHPNQMLIDLGAQTSISSIKVLPQQDMETGRIKDFRLFLADKLFKGL